MNLLFTIPFILYTALAITIVILIFKRLKDKKKEKFEKRDH